MMKKTTSCNFEFDYRSLQQYGKDVYIHPFVNITRPNYCILGNHIAIDFGFHCTTSLEIGNFLHIGPFTTVVGGVNGHLSIGNFCSIAAKASFICYGDTHKKGLVGALIDRDFRELEGGELVMEDYSCIGTGAIIFPNSIIRQGVVIGAGSILKGDTKAWTYYIGNPAKPIRERDSTSVLKAAEEMKKRYKL